MDCFMDGRHAEHQLLLWLIHELPVDDAKEGVHHQEEDELPTDELVQGALVIGICETYCCRRAFTEQ